VKDLHGILVFREVARTGGFSSAARQMNVTPAAVSRNIARLESGLGVRLLNRTTTEFHLMAEGAMLIKAISGSLDSLHHALETFDASQTALAGTLRISLTHSHGKFYVMPQMPRFSTSTRISSLRSVSATCGITWLLPALTLEPAMASRMTRIIFHA
jgi:DNA-binding transcriptional LysR family regulator